MQLSMQASKLTAVALSKSGKNKKKKERKKGNRKEKRKKDDGNSQETEQSPHV